MPRASRHPRSSCPTGLAYADAAYVVASALVLLLFWTQIPMAGRLLVFAVALVVEVFATLQFRAASAIKTRTAGLRGATGSTDGF